MKITITLEDTDDGVAFSLDGKTSGIHDEDGLAAIIAARLSIDLRDLALARLLRVRLVGPAVS